MSCCLFVEGWTYRGRECGSGLRPHTQVWEDSGPDPLKGQEGLCGSLRGSESWKAETAFGIRLFRDTQGSKGTDSDCIHQEPGVLILCQAAKCFTGTSALILTANLSTQHRASDRDGAQEMHKKK